MIGLSVLVVTRPLPDWTLSVEAVTRPLPDWVLSVGGAETAPLPNWVLSVVVVTRPFPVTVLSLVLPIVTLMVPELYAWQAADAER